MAGHGGVAALIQVSFIDADLDPVMEWNPSFCQAAQTLAIPKALTTSEKGMLEVVLQQARRMTFNPDEVHFHWLAWVAGSHGFKMVSMEQEAEISFFYQLLKAT